MKIIPQKIQYRNGIIDIIWGDRMADCFCLRHLKHWKEGKNFPFACIKCVKIVIRKILKE